MQAEATPPTPALIRTPPPHPSSYHREDDVQDQIEKYVENLCQIYSKGTGGRADSKIEEKVR